MSLPEPQRREARPHWGLVPLPVVAEIEKICGSSVSAADIQWGGYGPSANFRAKLANGKTVFIKGMWPGQTAHGAQMLRQEIALYRAIPALSELGSPFLGSVHEENEDGWHLGVWEYIEGAASPLPWNEEKIEKLFSLLARLVHADWRNDLPEARKLSFVRDLFTGENGWIKIGQNAQARERFLNIFSDSVEAARWAEKNLPRLTSIQQDVRGIDGPEGAMHNDLRSDNIVFDGQGNARVIDWPNAAFGPVVMDAVAICADIASESSFAAPELLHIYEGICGFRFSEKDVAASIAAQAGYYADNAGRAVPEKLPRLRWVQKRQLESLLRWLNTLERIEKVPVLA